MAPTSGLAGNPRGAEVYHVGIVLGILTTVAVILRLVARWKSKARFAADDLLIVLSLIPWYGMVALSYLVVSIAHFGLPISSLEPSDIATLMKILMSTILTYSLTITMVKISILMLYRRIFDTAAFRLKSLIVGTICVAWFFVAVFTDIFQCRPFEAVWDYQLLFTYHCINIQAYYWGISASNVALDILVLSLPIQEVWKLQLPRQKKVALSGVFLLGSVVCVAGIMRTMTISDLQTADITVTLVPQYAWAQVEPALAIICACIVTYRPLFASVNLDLTKISSIFSRSTPESGSKEDVWTESSTSNLPQEADLRLPGLSGRAAGKGLHVVHIDLGISGNPPMETFYKQPRSKHDVEQSVERHVKPRYKSPPFMSDGWTARVDPFV